MASSRNKDSHWHEEVDHSFAGLERFGRRAAYRLMSWFLAGPLIRPSEVDFSKLKRVLIVKEPYRMGDLFQITPLLRALQTEHPHLFIGLVIQDRNLPVFENNPRVNRLHLYEKKKINRNPFLLFPFISAIRKENYDLAVTLETDRAHLTNDMTAYYSGARYRLRYESSAWDGGVSNAFYNVLVPFDSSARHQVDKNFNVLAPLGLALEDRSLELRVRLAHLREAKKLLAGMGLSPDDGFVAVHPGAYKLMNRWPLEKYLDLAGKLRAAGRQVVFTLGPSEAGWEDRIRDAGMPVLAQSPLAVVSAVLSLSGLIICNDTGIMHVAGGLGVPTLALFAQTDPEQWKPPGEKVQAIRARDRSIASITVETVWDAAVHALDLSTSVSSVRV